MKSIEKNSGPCIINEGMWYYEERNAIALVINRRWFESATSNDGIIVNIPRRKLEASLRRMNASKRPIKPARASGK